jgi:hypothetical protein
MRQLLLFLLLTGCFQGPEQLLVQGPSAKKQKLKIAVLQKKLEQAEKEQQKAHTEVERLAAEIEKAKLALIRKQIDKYEQKTEKIASLFLEEREALYQMIQTGPSPAALEAQVELDRILRLITELSDEGKNV